MASVSHRRRLAACPYSAVDVLTTAVICSNCAHKWMQCAADVVLPVQLSHNREALQIEPNNFVLVQGWPMVSVVDLVSLAPESRYIWCFRAFW
jgi:hypothetical protein